MKKMSFSFTICLLFTVLSCRFTDKEIAVNSSVETQNFSEGETIYNDFCMQCHLPNGQGVPKTYPPLAQSDFLQNKRTESIKAIKYGLSGEIVVNGETYNTPMSSQGLTNKEIADVMNYITNSWGNKNTSLITEAEVSRVER